MTQTQEPSYITIKFTNEEVSFETNIDWDNFSEAYFYDFVENLFKIHKGVKNV